MPEINNRKPQTANHKPYITLIAVLILTSTAFAQEPPTVRTPEGPKAGQAFLRSLVLPGWGHQYAQGGSWRGMATIYAGADVGLWVGLINANWRRDRLVQNYQTLAATRAGADIDGKDRTFYLNLATFLSSDAYLDTQLRNRAWDRIDYVSDPAFFWEWESVEDFQNFRDLRDDAESLGRRRSIFVALLVANRVLAGIGSIQAANRNAPTVSMSFSPPPGNQRLPILNTTIVF